MVAGEDFEGLMRVARLSIGLCLLHRDITIENSYEHNRYFWLHYLDAMIQLSMASDRIRDYFIIAFFKIDPREYCKDKRTRKYIAPFEEAKIHLSKIKD